MILLAIQHTNRNLLAAIVAPVRFEFDAQGESAVGVCCSDRAGERGSRGRQITSAARPWRMLQARNR
jgi:hypothetical protein